MLSGVQHAGDIKTKSTNKSILLVGESGSGKTTFLRTMPKPFVCIFDPNGKEALAETHGLSFKPYSIDGSGWKEFRKDLEEVRKNPHTVLEGYDTFALDSLTFAADACMAGVLQKSNKQADAQITIQEWGDAIRQIKDVMAIITTLPLHTVVTAHIAVEKDELTGGLLRLPLIYGKELPGKLPAYFNEVWFTSVECKQEGANTKVNYRVQLLPDQKYTFAKTGLNKSGKLERYEKPDFASVLAKSVG